MNPNAGIAVTMPAAAPCSRALTASEVAALKPGPHSPIPRPINAMAMKNAGSVALTKAPPGRYDTLNNLDPESVTKQYGASLKISQEFKPFRVVSISAYRHITSTQNFAQDGNSVATLNFALEYNVKTFTQELQLLSHVDSPIQWVLGGFYLHDTSATVPLYFYGTNAGGGSNKRYYVASQLTNSF